MNGIELITAERQYRIDVEERVDNILSADPDIPLTLRFVYMEHFLLTGNYLIWYQ